MVYNDILMETIGISVMVSIGLLLFCFCRVFIYLFIYSILNIFTSKLIQVSNTLCNTAELM